MNRKRIVRTLVGVVFSTLVMVCCVCKNPNITYAITNTDEGYDESRGMVCVRLIYTDATGLEHVLKKGTGFFVGNGTNEEYILTAKNLVTLTPDEQQMYATQFEVEYKDVVRDLSIDASIDGNIRIKLNTEYADSENLDLAILSPSTSLGDITNLRLSVEPEWLDSDPQVYTLGFMDVVNDNLAVVKGAGTVKQEVELFGYSSYQHDVVMSPNNIGGPLLNVEGEVVGLNLAYTDGNYYSVEADEIINLMDALGLAYNEPYLINTYNLERAIERYEESTFKGYTDESVQRCELAYAQAVNRLEQAKKDTENGCNTKYSQTEIDEITTELNLSLEQLEVKEVPLKTFIIIMIIAGVLLIGAAVAITLLAVRVNLLKKELKETKSVNLTPQDILQMGGRITPGGTASPKNSMPINRTLSEIASSSEKLTMQNHTPVPSQTVSPSGVIYPAETSVLNVVSMQDVNMQDNMLIKCPKLIRRKTGELIQITKSSFVLGKAGDQVDFFVGGNTNISRKHACIKKMADGYYIQDLNSTNGTFVNQCRVSWNRDVKLNSGDVIALGDDEFEFNEE